MFMKIYSFFLLAVFLIVLFGPSAVFGQNGCVSGQVTDPLANGIANLAVEFYDSVTAELIDTVHTDGSGNYTDPDLPPRHLQGPLLFRSARRDSRGPRVVQRQDLF
jgi:hypothetical protein